MATYAPLEFKIEQYLDGKRLTTGNSLNGHSAMQVAREFRRLCPYEVTWPGTVWDIIERTIMANWCQENCTGYWSTSIVLRQNLFDQPIWIFQEATDAVMFRLNIPTIPPNVD